MATTLGKRVKETRLKRGLTLESLAARASSSKSYMWAIENHSVVRPSAEKLRQIALALETTVDYLLSADAVTAEDAEDQAFFRSYQKMTPKGKERIRKIAGILDDAEADVTQSPD